MSYNLFPECTTPVLIYSPTDDTEDEWSEHFSASIFGCDSLLQWQALSRPDREIINQMGNGLGCHKPEVIRESCEDLTSNVLENFPPEIFIQRPDVVFRLQDILILNVRELNQSV